MTIRRLTITTLLLPTFFVPIVGCGGANSGMNVRKPPSERPDVDTRMVSRGVLRIPSDEPFNYSEVQSSQKGERARGEALPVGRNGASCKAEVRDEGEASGEFLLGYCFDNMSGEALDAVIRLKLTVDETTSHDGGSESEKGTPTATGRLSFLVKDGTNGVELKRENLVASDLSKGPQASSNTPELVFDVKFEPNRGYYLVLSGHTAVKTGPGQSAMVKLEVTDASLEISWRGAESAVKFKEGAATHSGRGSEARANSARRLPSEGEYE